MAEYNDNILINQVDPDTFEFQQYTEQDNILISSSRLDTAFTSSTDYIEYYAYDNSNNLIFPTPDSTLRAFNQRNYSVLEGDTCIYPAQDLQNLGFDEGTFYSTYNFYRKLLASDIEKNYFISEISSDRTEVRLKSTAIDPELIISSSEAYITFREEQDYFVDFLLNFGNDQQCIANNIKLDVDSDPEPSVLIKLYEPLPDQFVVKSTLWVVQEISSPQAYNVVFPEVEFIPDDSQAIKGPNYSIQITQQTGESSQEFNYDTLVNSDVTSSFQQLQNLLDRKEINISVDYTDFNNFVYFSSAQTRLENFYYKVGLIQSSSNAIEGLTTSSGNYSASKAEINNSIEHIIKNFDGYEYFLYFNSGSDFSYPKTSTEPPYILAPTGSAQAKNWLGSADPTSPFYGGLALTASNYDEDNPNYLQKAIPEYLRSDPDNVKYELFVDMVAQQYDNTWLYTKNITTRFDADNRLDFGISKDLVADAIKDFGIKLYSNNFNSNDLYTSFLGLTPSGSTFPINNITGSVFGGVVNTPEGFEYVTTQISASNDIVPLDNVNKQLYKRIYHNVPYLLKTKGTLTGLRALITSYGIPNTILRINEFGGKDRNNLRDWDFFQEVYNFALDVKQDNFISSSFQLNSGFQGVASNTPKSLQYRFKTPGIPTSSAYYNMWVGDQNTAFITLEYTGTGLASGSYSGSVAALDKSYGTLTFYPDGITEINKTASLTLPFFDGGWWSVQATVDYDNTDDAFLYAANRIGEKIGFSGSDSVNHSWQYWDIVENSFFPSSSTLGLPGQDYEPFSGSYQELRYWDVALSESLFYDYVMNPYSTQGNTINSTPDDLAFRADLGTELNTGSRVSIHPKVTGSWEVTQSFTDNTSTFFLSGSFSSNTESIYYNQVPGGIKNRIDDKIKIDQEVLPSGSTLSPFISIQQQTFPSGSDPSINYLEVAFSPTDQVNDDIISQIGAFNLGDYIGDPRQISESGVNYPDLDRLRDAYFEKYINSYDVNDFIRLIKFFDNSLFKMIEDFTPARTSLTSGVVVKQNLLERNRQAPPSASFTTPEYTGSIKPFARDYQLPNTNKRVVASSNQEALVSSSFPQYSDISGSSIEVFRGGTGGVFEPYNNLFAAPVSESTSKFCLEGYFYTSSVTLFDVNDTPGESLFNQVISNNFNTMSINISGSTGVKYLDFLQTLATSSLTQDNFVTYGTSTNNQNRYKIDRIAFGGGYGGEGSDYGEIAYGQNFSQSVFFELTLTDNDLDEGFTDQDGVDICFFISGEPYSGLSEAEVSASTFFSQYDHMVQAWSESIVPSLGITPPYPQQNTSSNSLGPVNYPRIDQREFYNGEFGDNLDIRMEEICKAFFGQDAIIDYFFRVQFFNESNFPEQDFLSSDNLPLAGNVWFWADIINPSGELTLNGNLNVFQQPMNGASGPAVSDAIINLENGVGGVTITNPGSATGGKMSLSTSGTGNFNIVATITAAGSGYNVGSTITVAQATLVSAGFTSASQDLIINLTPGNIANNSTGKVKYIKMSNVDVNGQTIIPFIQDSGFVNFKLTGAADVNNVLIEGFQTWYISNSSFQDDNNPDTTDATLLVINQEPSSDAVSSYDTQFYDLTFSASGVFTFYGTSSGEDPTVTRDTGITASIPQGYFPPVSTFPTESFFRGWATSSYLQADSEGVIYRVTSGSGFNTDTTANFQQGSVENDFDDSIPYTASTGPWFMNAPSTTLEVLDNSSLVGDLGAGKLQLYTGSITASSVEIGPAFEKFVNPTPVQGQQVLQDVTLNAEGNLNTILFSATQNNLTTLQAAVNPIGGRRGTITITAPSSVTVTISTNGATWYSQDKTEVTGNGVVTFTAQAAPFSATNSEPSLRSNAILLTNNQNPNNTLTFTIRQSIFVNSESDSSEGIFIDDVNTP